jgi:hypothetical protein
LPIRFGRLLSQPEPVLFCSASFFKPLFPIITQM